MSKRWLIIFGSLILSACTSVPEGVDPVSGFDVERYQGKWYEIARLDHDFEAGLTDVTAEYALNDDGTVAVINRGYSQESNSWEEADGKAKFVGDDEMARLKVSFFGPFYGSYVVFGLDKADYQYAFVAGPSHEYLWLLARTPQISESVRSEFIEAAEQAGFETETLIWVEHNRSDVQPVTRQE